MKKTKKAFLSIMTGLLLVLPFNSAFAAEATTTQSLSTNQVVEQYVDMGGYNLFTHTEYTNNYIKDYLPTVVFESGFGEDHTAWENVQPAIAKITNTVSYDRGALGNSDVSPAPRDAVGIATELHTLLEKLDVPKPYILVGHSMGAQYIRVFQDLYPNSVAGILTVDGTVDTFTTQIVPLFDPMLQDLYETQAFTDPNLGLYSDIQAGELQAQAARPSLKNVYLTVLCPEYQVGPMSPPEAQALAPLTNPEVTDPLWKSLQEDLAQQSDKGKFVYVEETPHEINIYKPEVIIKEIAIMIAKVAIDQYA